MSSIKMGKIQTRPPGKNRLAAAKRSGLCSDYHLRLVGEATSLPGGSTLQNYEDSGEFVQITNILPFNQPLKRRNLAGGW